MFLRTLFSIFMVLVKRLSTRLFWTLPPVFVVFGKIVHTADLNVTVAPDYQQVYALKDSSLFCNTFMVVILILVGDVNFLGINFSYCVLFSLIVFWCSCFSSFIACQVSRDSVDVQVSSKSCVLWIYLFDLHKLCTLPQ